MYFPFLRGKQFELIALRELVDLLGEKKDKISPIIEPVKESTSTIKSTIQGFIENNVNFNIVLNPIVGDLKRKQNFIVQIIEEYLSEYSNYQISLYINSSGDVDRNRRFLERIRSYDFKGFSLVHITPLNNLSFLEQILDVGEIKYNLIDLSRTNRRYHRNFAKETRISLDDYFRIAKKNSDYQDTPDELYTDEHLFYEEDGYIGFSDFLTIGEPYAESGFLPYAVVIHLTYADSDSVIRIRHFVSNSNEDSSDVAGKFSEALEKLIEWVDENDVDSRAIREFRNYHDENHFPGLGVIKKLSIMHHIELVLSLI